MSTDDPRGFRFRDTTRAPFQATVRLRFDRHEGSETAQSADLSMEGMFVVTDEPKAVGTLVQFELDAEGLEDPIQGLGDVVWLRSGDLVTPAKPMGMGIQFRYVDPRSRDQIFKIVSEYLQKDGAQLGGRQPMSPTDPTSAGTLSASAAVASLPPAGAQGVLPDYEADAPPQPLPSLTQALSGSPVAADVGTGAAVEQPTAAGGDSGDGDLEPFRLDDEGLAEDTKVDFASPAASPVGGAATPAAEAAPPSTELGGSALPALDLGAVVESRDTADALSEAPAGAGLATSPESDAGGRDTSDSSIPPGAAPSEPRPPAVAPPAPTKPGEGLLERLGPVPAATMPPATVGTPAQSPPALSSLGGLDSADGGESLPEAPLPPIAGREASASVDPSGDVAPETSDAIAPTPASPPSAPFGDLSAIDSAPAPALAEPPSASGTAAPQETSSPRLSLDDLVSRPAAPAPAVQAPLVEMPTADQLRSPLEPGEFRAQKSKSGSRLLLPVALIVVLVGAALFWTRSSWLPLIGGGGVDAETQAAADTELADAAVDPAPTEDPSQASDEPEAAQAGGSDAPPPGETPTADVPAETAATGDAPPPASTAVEPAAVETAAVEPAATDPVAAQPAPPARTTGGSGAQAIQGLGVRESPTATTLEIVGDSAFVIGQVDALRLEGPPRFVVKLRGVGASFRTGARGQRVTGIRTGMHPGPELHLVLDLLREDLEATADVVDGVLLIRVEDL